MARLYKCPSCGFGRRAPEKLHREDSRRFCFACSEKTGRLVRLVAPTVEQAKAAAKATRKAKADATREREAKREFERLHTWPGVRELRWKKWGRGLIKKLPNGGALPKAQSVSRSIGEAYAEMFRLGMPRYNDGNPVGSAAARDKFLRQVGVTDKETRATIAGESSTHEWHEVFRWVQDNGLDWFMEDLGIEDPVARAAIRNIAEKTRPGNLDDRAILNTLITNALALRETSSTPERDDDGYNEMADADDEVLSLAYVPIGDWQGAHP